MTTARVIPSSKREGEEGVGAVLFRSRVAHMLLAWGALYGAKNHMEKAHGATFVPFYSAKRENVSEKRSKVARPQSKSADSRILIQKGNEVAQPLCQFFSLWRGAEFDCKRKLCGATFLPLDRIRKVWQKSLFQMEFLLYLNGTMGN